jgi:hypothetical protein
MKPPFDIVLTDCDQWASVTANGDAAEAWLEAWMIESGRDVQVAWSIYWGEVSPLANDAIRAGFTIDM